MTKVSRFRCIYPVRARARASPIRDAVASVILLRFGTVIPSALASRNPNRNSMFNFFLS